MISRNIVMHFRFYKVHAVSKLNQFPNKITSILSLPTRSKLPVLAKNFMANPALWIGLLRTYTVKTYKYLYIMLMVIQKTKFDLTLNNFHKLKNNYRR